MNSWIALLTGVLCAAVGGELFVRGAVGLAKWARISAGIIGATVAAFATSSPELSVAIGSALSGKPEISLGDAVGSNVVNIALILALVLCISSIQAPRESIRRDFPVALFVPLILGLLGLDGGLSRGDGLILLALFFSWLVAVTIAVRRERSASSELLGETKLGRALFLSVVGLAFLVCSGHFIVTGARDIAASMGIPEFIIGATIVAVGTSMPELATSLISKIRGHDEIGLGTILGSNIFNGLFIIGVAAVICPIHIDHQEVTKALVLGFVTTAVTFPPKSGLLSRRRGVILLVLYAAYVFSLVAH